MTNLPAALPDECDSFSQIETVWPRTLDEYERVRVLVVHIFLFFSKNLFGYPFVGLILSQARLLRPA
jgi:hypothetical protein